MAGKPKLDTDDMQLGRWMHEALFERPWQDVAAATKDKYYALARKLLEDPPAVLRAAVRKLAD